MSSLPLDILFDISRKENALEGLKVVAQLLMLGLGVSGSPSPSNSGIDAWVSTKIPTSTALAGADKAIGKALPSACMVPPPDVDTPANPLQEISSILCLTEREDSGLEKAFRYNFLTLAGSIPARKRNAIIIRK